MELNDCLSLDNLPGRDLDPAELAELAGGLAAQPHLWEDKVAYSDEERVFASLHRDANVDVWLICWTPVNDTGWHDHDVSSGAVAVARGKLVEHNLAIGTESVETEIEALRRLRLRPRPHPPGSRPRQGQRHHPRLQPAAVAHGPVLRQGRRPPPSLRLLRRRTPPHRLIHRLRTAASTHSVRPFCIPQSHPTRSRLCRRTWGRAAHPPSPHPHLPADAQTRTLVLAPHYATT